MSKQKEEFETTNVPIRLSDALILDAGYSATKDGVAAQMKEIEAEMGRISSLATQSQSLAGSDTTASRPYNVEFLNNSSLVEGEGAARKLKLQFDVSQFDPSEVTVNIVNNKIVVSAAHREKTDNTVTLREFQREFFFPDGVDPDTFESSLSREGILVVEAPYPAITDKTLAK